MFNLPLVAMLVCVVILSCSCAVWMIMDIKERNRIDRERRRIEERIGRGMFNVD